MSNRPKPPMQAGTVIAECEATTARLFKVAQKTEVYRGSIAYMLQTIRSVLHGIRGLAGRDFEASEIQALKRFDGHVDHFAVHIVAPASESSLETILGWSVTHVHSYIGELRKTLGVVCADLSLDAGALVAVNRSQDAVNRTADLRNLQQTLGRLQSAHISRPNSIHVQQQIEERLRSIVA